MDGIDTALLTLWPPALGPIVQESLRDSSSGTAPRVSTFCLPDVTTRDVPGLPPPYLHTVSDQILEVRTGWERGYAFPVPPCQ